jgi:hypothetical protein
LPHPASTPNGRGQTIRGGLCSWAPDSVLCTHSWCLERIGWAGL